MTFSSAPALHNFHSERFFNDSLVLIQVKYLLKDYCFQQRSCIWNKEDKQAGVLGEHSDYDARGCEETSSGINRTFRRVNVKWHQRWMREEEEEKWFSCQSSYSHAETEREGRREGGREDGGIMAPGCRCTFLNSADRENRHIHTEKAYNKQYTNNCGGH